MATAGWLLSANKVMQAVISCTICLLIRSSNITVSTVTKGALPILCAVLVVHFKIRKRVQLLAYSTTSRLFHVLKYWCAGTSTVIASALKIILWGKYILL